MYRIMDDLNATIKILKHIDEAANTAFSLSVNIAQIKDRSEYRPKYSYNLFKYFGTDEPVTSWAISHTLSFPGPDKSYPLLKSFIAKYLSHLIDVSAVKSPSIRCERNKIDISVYDKGYAIIIENKLKGALFQRNQLARYIRAVEECGYMPRQMSIVILPTHLDISIPESVWRLPPDWYKPNPERLCAVANDITLCRCDIEDTAIDGHCERCIDYKKKISQRTVVVGNGLAAWLDETIDVIPRREYSLISHVCQLKDYLESDEVFKTNENQQLDMEMQSYIKSILFVPGDNAETKMDKLREQEANLIECQQQIHKLMLEVRGEIQQNIVNRIMNTLDFLPKKLVLGLYHTSDGIFSGFKTDLGFWIGIEHMPDVSSKFYVTIYSPNEDFSTVSRSKAVAIFERADLKEKDPDNSRYVFQYTDDPEADLTQLLLAAHELGIELK